MNQLIVDKISKKIQARQIVDNISFSVKSGQVVGLLGPNGAGKTTTFCMIVGLVKPDQGRVLVDDTDLSLMPMFQRALKGVGYLPQESSIFQRMTVENNIRVALEIRFVSEKDRSEALEKLLQEFNLKPIRNSYGYALSGGERRRVEIARCLAGSPQFLLLDEPFSGIDPIAVGEMKEIIKKLKAQGIGVLLTDHNARDTLGICDYALILKQGKVEVEGEPEKLVNSEKARQFYLGRDFKL